MKSMNLLLALGNVKDGYILAAEEFREGKPRRIAPKRLWLIAAVIALCLVLVGCAVAYALRLEDMAFGQKHQEYYDGSSQTVTLLSIQGVQGTPGYQATREWYEWLETYDQDMSVYHSEEAFSEDFGEEYLAYNLYSREMKDKLDEICQKYGLELLMVLDYGGARGNATMYAEYGDYVYLLTISEFEDVPLPDQVGLEAYAECFDFSVEPQRITEADIAAVEVRREEADQAAEKEEYYYARFRFCKDNNSILYPREGYDGSIEAYLTYVREHDDGRRTCFALWDIDSDGEEEVFLGTEDGNLIEMLKMEDGVVSIRFCDYVCQGNVLEDYFTYGFYPNGETTTRREGSGHVYKDIDGTILFRLLYDTETGAWREGSRYWDSATTISAEQAREIIARYPRLGLEMQPLSQYSED